MQNLATNETRARFLIGDGNGSGGFILCCGHLHGPDGLWNAVLKARGRLSIMQEIVICALYGQNGYEKPTQAKLARLLGVRRMDIGRHHKSALEVLKGGLVDWKNLYLSSRYVTSLRRP